MTANLPPIGSYCMERVPSVPSHKQHVWKVSGVRGRSIVEAGCMVVPNPIVTIVDQANGETRHMSLDRFHKDYTDVVN